MTPTASKSTPKNRIRIVSLLDGGDWNCAHDQEESLACVARELATSVTGGLAVELSAIAKLATADFVEATRRWEETSHKLRNQLGRSPARSGEPPGSTQEPKQTR
jgi:hypothetical protein